MRSIEELKEHFPQIEFSDKYLEILNYIRDKDDCKLSIQGNSGSGKSTLLKLIHYMFSDDIENHRMNIAVASSTGVASALLNNNTNIGATTVHSLFKLKPKDIYGSFRPNDISPNAREVLENLDILIIDEISMISCDLFDYIMAILFYCRKRQPTRVLLFGDCMQLQCVIKDDDIIKSHFDIEYNGNHSFFSSKIFKREFQTFLLTKIYRQDGDEKFKDILNRIRVNEQTQDDLDYLNQRVISEEDYIINNESFLRIVSTNKDVQKYNQIALDSLDGKYIVLEAEITGTFRESTEFKSGAFMEKIFVKKGCAVMITRNSSEKRQDGTLEYYNGNIGTLIDCNDDYATVDLGEDGIVKVPHSVTNCYEYEVVHEDGNSYVKCRITGSYDNIMIKPCSASTIHKVQGLTLNNGYLDFGRWIPECGLYVALSRFRNINSFGLRRPIEMRDISVNKESLNYIKNAEYTESVYNELFENSESENNEDKIKFENKVDLIKKFFEENNLVFKDGKIIDKITNFEIKV